MEMCIRDRFAAVCAIIGTAERSATGGGRAGALYGVAVHPAVSYTHLLRERLRGFFGTVQLALHRGGTGLLFYGAPSGPGLDVYKRQITLSSLWAAKCSGLFEDSPRGNVSCGRATIKFAQCELDCSVRI